MLQHPSLPIVGSESTMVHTTNNQQTAVLPSQTHFFLSSPAQPIHMDHKRTKLFGKKMSVLTMNDKKWLIGVQMAHLLQRETYNLYRSMKVKYIAVQRATPDQVDFLVKTNVVKPGTRSITFVPFEPAIAYISEEIKKVGTRKKKKNNNSSSSGSNNPTEDLTSQAIVPNVKQPVSIGSPQSAFELLCATAEVEYTSSPKQLLAAAVAKGQHSLIQQYQQQLQQQQQQLQQQQQQFQQLQGGSSPFSLSHYGAFQLPPPQPSMRSQDAVSTHFAIANLLNDTKLPGLGNLPFFPTLPQLPLPQMSSNYSSLLQSLNNSVSSSPSSSSASSSHKNLTELYDALSNSNNRVLGNVV